jgi:putative transposase
MWGKHLNCARLQKHIANRRKRNPWWLPAGSQAVHAICQRIENTHQLFFKHKDKGDRPPKVKKTKQYKSFTPKQAGYTFLCFETFNLKTMQRLWGRKVSDLAFREFLQILEWVATNPHPQPFCRRRRTLKALSPKTAQ